MPKNERGEIMRYSTKIKPQEEVLTSENEIYMPVFVLKDATNEESKAFEKLVQDFIKNNFKVPVKFKVVKNT